MTRQALALRTGAVASVRQVHDGIADRGILSVVLASIAETASARPRRSNRPASLEDLIWGESGRSRSEPAKLEFLQHVREYSEGIVDLGGIDDEGWRNDEV